MGIISKIKSVLGVEGDGQERAPERGRSAAVDAEPETTSERAVKGVDETGADRPSDGDGTTRTEEPAGTAGEPAESEGEPAGVGGEPVDSIKGIGAAYAERLADAGVHSVDDLARADAEELAAATDLGTGRVGKWIERAQARTE